MKNSIKKLLGLVLSLLLVGVAFGYRTHQEAYKEAYIMSPAERYHIDHIDDRN